ncbi:MAG: carboxylesterase family protein [Bacilli bacterium]|nr:carboxylesterase family protein [Bacilli bacterium]
MFKKHLAFWIAFPIGFLLLAAFLIFLFDLTNGPLVLFILEMVALAALAATCIIFIDKKIPFRLIPWGAFIITSAILISLSKPSSARISATLFNNPEKTSVLTLANGQVQGAYTKNKDVEVYAGIPYAKAPVGDLRWKPTQPADDWNGVKDCTYFAPKSMQPASNPIMSTLVDMYAEGGWHPDYNMHPTEYVSEDSLYLNIWRPAGISPSEKLPILVYIHGGSLTTGSSARSDYNGESMARQGVIMITIAYRLGVFGYFAHQDLINESSEHTTGNYGLLDQIQALRWVNENASYFGGDSSNITIAGESAGSSSVSALCASELASGLFQKAIGESSSVVGYRAPHTFRKMSKALETGDKIMKEMGCSSIEELRKIPADRLVQTSYSNDSMTVDGYALTKTPHEIYQEGKNNEVALLNGYNVKEADAFVVPRFLFNPTNSSNIEARLIDYFDEKAAKELMAAYETEIKNDAFSAFNEIISAYWFMQPHMDWSAAALNNGEDVYRYQFTKENGFYGTYHSGEMIYCYGNIDKSIRQFAYNDEDRALSKTMLTYWANFVKAGDPNDGIQPNWPKWTSTDDKIMELGTNLGLIDEKDKKAYEILDAWKVREEQRDAAA